MKDPNELAVVLNVRKNSQRCKNKLLRPYADTSLFNIAIDKLSKLNWPETFVGAYENEFKVKIDQYTNIQFVERSYKSAHAAKGAQLIFEMYTKIKHKWVFWINPCHALLTVDTIKKAIDKFLIIENRSMTSVKPYLGWFYDQDGNPLNNKNCFTGVNSNDYLYVGAHAFHAYERETPLKEDRVWNNVKGDPYLFPIPEAEAYDVDTEEDFLISELLYKYRKSVK